MKTAMQELIQWTIENAFNVEAQDGTNYIAIDHEEMRTKFDKWLEQEKRQAINFHIETIKQGLIEEGEKKWHEAYKPRVEEIANKSYDYIFDASP